MPTQMPLHMPLRGSRLIEASAGTGKTWTLAALVVRLVLGMGDTVRRAPQDQPLWPADILVVTFTRAATRELADRIRARLSHTAAVLRGQAVADAQDALLQTVLQTFADGPAREEAAWRLAWAAESMDQAAIHTLDGWCQRVLRECAPAAAWRPDLQVSSEAGDDLLEAARDVWRQAVYPLADQALEAARAACDGPEALAALAKPALERPLPTPDALDPAAPPAAPAGQPSTPQGTPPLAPATITTLAAWLAQALAQQQAIRAGWPQRFQAMHDWLAHQLQLPGQHWKGNLLKSNWLKGWFEKLQAWAQDPWMAQPDLSESGRARLCPAGLQEARKAGAPPLALSPDWAALDALLATLAQQIPVQTRLKLWLVHAVRQRFEANRQRALRLGHTGVQKRLADWLDETAHGEDARRLRAQVLQRWPVALVDEFQDTSPLQLQILDSLYRIADNDPAHALLMIGDPKQSIYAFRNADIHGYLLARAHTAGRHHALQTNHRSTPALVQAVNSLFNLAEARAGEGAFRFRTPAQDPLPFVPVMARGGHGQLRNAAGAPLPPLHVCCEAVDGSAQAAVQQLAERAAQAMAALLATGATHWAGDDTPDHTRPLRPADVAVLVRTARQADVVRRAMQRRGLRSVFLSDRDSVFDSPEAADLLLLLQAVAEPGDARAAHTLVASSLWGLDVPSLCAWADDEHQQARFAEQLREWQAIWRSQGVLAMLRQALHAQGLPARWLAQRTPGSGGERRLTNVLHLAELLQQAAAERDGEAALHRWLATRVAQAGNEDDDAQEAVLRMESDDDRIRVVTVHKSKGLEYPVVFIPFGTVTKGKRAGQSPAPWVWLPGPHGPQAVVQPSATNLAAEALEKEREDIRLLYVALTRARHHVWLGASTHWTGQRREPAWPRSALGYLLGGGDAPADAQLATWQAAAAGTVQVEHRTAQDPVGLTLWADDQPARPLAPLQTYGGYAAPAWGISSYSALVRASTGTADAAPLSTVPNPVLREDETLSLAVTGDAAPDTAPWHSLPRGPQVGNQLHEWLEWLATEHFALAQTPALQQALQRRVQRAGWGHRADALERWLSRLCTQPLPPLGAPLSHVHQHLPEMEFWLPADGLDVAQLDALCRAHVLPGWPRPALGTRRLQGLLMGFADLVIQHEGRFWVLDYKSNALGPGDAAYNPQALAQAICSHRYDVQAALYLLPLHRLLRARLGPAYQPQQHLGGALYWFVRGVGAPGAGCCWLPPPWPLLQALDEALPSAQPGP
jgi:exodeoxyribonuclease V beta subunit